MAQKQQHKYIPTKRGAFVKCTLILNKHLEVFLNPLIKFYSKLVFILSYSARANVEIIFLRFQFNKFSASIQCYW